MNAGCPMEQQKQQPSQNLRFMPTKQSLPGWAYIALLIIFMIAIIIVDTKYNIGIGKLFTGFM